MSLAAGAAEAQQDFPVYVCSRDAITTCERGRGCAESDPTGIFVRFDFNENTYQRCEASDCDSYPMVVSSSGEFLNLELPGRATFARVGPIGEFMEVISLGMVAVVAYGTCRPES
jgi:hypothetical protein